MSFSVRPSPPNQIARFCSRSLTTIRYTCRFFVDTDDVRRRMPGMRELLAHIDFVQLFDGMPIEMHPPRHVLDCHRTAQSTDLHRKSQGVLWICLLYTSDAADEED